MTKNREVYLKDPVENRLLNDGVAEVTDGRSDAEMRTLRYELETFVCDGEYAKGMRRILDTYIRNLDQHREGIQTIQFLDPLAEIVRQFLQGFFGQPRFRNLGAIACRRNYLALVSEMFLIESGALVHRRLLHSLQCQVRTHASQDLASLKRRRHIVRGSGRKDVVAGLEVSLRENTEDRYVAGRLVGLEPAAERIAVCVR